MIRIGITGTNTADERTAIAEWLSKRGFPTFPDAVASLKKALEKWNEQARFSPTPEQHEDFRKNVLSRQKGYYTSAESGKTNFYITPIIETFADIKARDLWITAFQLLNYETEWEIFHPDYNCLFHLPLSAKNAQDELLKTLDEQKLQLFKNYEYTPILLPFANSINKSTIQEVTQQNIDFILSELDKSWLLHK